jgi:acetoin utilization deacetylase AcuC-like enzyme
MPRVTLSTPFIWSEDCTRHDPKGEVWVGVTIEGTEVAQRAVVIREALREAGAPELPADSHDDAGLLSVHSGELVSWLRDCYPQWIEGGFLEVPGQPRVVPYLFPTEAMLSGLPIRSPSGIHGRAGRFAYDTMTLVGPGTWEAARGAVDAALSAVDHVVSGNGRLAYALCRPPGHHATAEGYATP